MAYLGLSFPRTFTARLRPLTRLLQALGDSLAALTEARSRRDQIERLQALSDAQLLAMGLRRDQIVAHVFRDTLGV